MRFPANEQTQEDFEWVLKEIIEGGGDAVICEARMVDGLSDVQIGAMFNAARDADYGTLAKEARALDEKIADQANPGARDHHGTHHDRRARRASRSRLGYPARRPCRPHRLGLAGPPLHRSGRPILVRARKGVQAAGR
jgi:hypothetical protein